MRVSIICIGNELLLDDGVGPAVARYIASRYELPDNVCVLDRACMGMAILSDLRSCDFALVLDAIDIPGEEPGRLFAFDPHDAAPTPPGATSLHDMRFADVVDAAQMLGIQVDGHCMGVQVENRSPSEFVNALTPRVAAAVPLLAQAAVRYLRDKLHVEIRDALPGRDLLRAGLRSDGARDFSRGGTRREVCCGDEHSDGGEVGGCCDNGVELPSIYGEPDAQVMAAYLAAGLRGVGACGELVQDMSSTGCQAVSLALPLSCATDIAETFGLERVGDSADSRCQLTAFVHPQTTDYDCDALIGACLDAIEESE